MPDIITTSYHNHDNNDDENHYDHNHNNISNNNTYYDSLMDVSDLDIYRKRKSSADYQDCIEFHIQEESTSNRITPYMIEHARNIVGTKCSASFLLSKLEEMIYEEEENNKKKRLQIIEDLKENEIQRNKSFAGILKTVFNIEEGIIINSEEAENLSLPASNNNLIQKLLTGCWVYRVQKPALGKIFGSRLYVKQEFLRLTEHNSYNDNITIIDNDNSSSGCNNNIKRHVYYIKLGSSNPICCDNISNIEYGCRSRVSRVLDVPPHLCLSLQLKCSPKKMEFITVNPSDVEDWYYGLHQITFLRNNKTPYEIAQFRLKQHYLDMEYSRNTEKLFDRLIATSSYDMKKSTTTTRTFSPIFATLLSMRKKRLSTVPSSVESETERFAISREDDDSEESPKTHCNIHIVNMKNIENHNNHDNTNNNNNNTNSNSNHTLDWIRKGSFKLPTWISKKPS